MGFGRQRFDSSRDAPFQVRHGFAVFAWVDRVLQKIQGTFKDLYNVQWNLIGHDNFTAFNRFNVLGTQSIQTKMPGKARGFTTRTFVTRYLVNPHKALRCLRWRSCRVAWR